MTDRIMPEDRPAELLTAAQAADRLGIATQTLAKWRLTGAGPAFLKIGSRVAYDARDLSAWLASRRRTSTSSTRASAGATCSA